MSGPREQFLDEDELHRINAWWRAANYLSVGQIYLLDNPLLREPLRIEHIKPRLLGHWGTTPGLNLVYVHLNRVIRRHDLNVLFVTGPGHGAPGILANTWLEGSYSAHYPAISRDERGCASCSGSFPFPAVSPATRHRKRRGRSTKGANSVTPSVTPMAPSSTTLT